MPIKEFINAYFRTLEEFQRLFLLHNTLFSCFFSMNKSHSH